MFQNIKNIYKFEKKKIKNIDLVINKKILYYFINFKLNSKKVNVHIFITKLCCGILFQQNLLPTIFYFIFIYNSFKHIFILKFTEIKV